MNLRNFRNALFLGIFFVLTNALTASAEETSPDTTPKALHYILISDTHLGFRKSNEAFAAFLQDVAHLPFPVEGIIDNGDIAEKGDPAVFKFYQSSLQALGIPHWSVIGNHDTRWNSRGKEDYRELIGPLYFSKNFFGIHWMFLDSTIEHQTQGHIDSREMKWIQQDLSGVPRKEPILVFSHHPLKWNGISVDNGLDALNLFSGHRVAAFFNGHGHRLARISFRGVPLIENEALFHGEYLVMKQQGNEIQLFQKQIGEPELAPWFTFSLHSKPLLRLTLFPQDRKRVPGKFLIQIQPPVKVPSWIQVDREEKETTSLSLQIPGQGWHRIKWFTGDAPFPQDEADVFLPGTLKKFPFGEIYAGLAADEKLVFSGTLSGNLIALNTQGKVRWEKQLAGDVLASPEFWQGILYAGTRKGILYAFQASNGKFMWKWNSAFPLTAPPLVSHGVVYQASGDNILYAFAAKTGEILWKTPLDGFTEAKPVATRDEIFVGTWNRTFYAIQTKDGKTLWKKTIGKEIYYSPSVVSPILAGNLVLVPAKDHRLYAFRQDTGKEEWRVPVNDGFSNPVLVKGELIVPETNGNIIALSPNAGKTLWSQKFPASFYNASPVLAGNHLILPGVEGQLFFYNLLLKKLDKQFTLSHGFLFSTPVVAGGSLWAGSLDGNLYKVPLPSPAVPSQEFSQTKEKKN